MPQSCVIDQIAEVVRHRCGGRVFSSLARELQKGAVSETEFLDHLVTFCHTALPELEVPSILIEIGDILKGTGQMQKAAEMYSHVLSGEGGTTRSSQNDGVRAEAFLRRGEVHSCLGHWRESRADLTQSRSLFGSLKEKTAVGRVDNILGTNYAEQGKTTMAEKFFHKAYVAFEESGQDEMIGTALMNLGIVQNIRGNYQQALGQYRRAQSIFERLGDLRRLAQLHHNIGMTYLQWNRTKEAIVEFDASYFLGSKQQQEPVMATSLLGKANAFYKRSDLDVAAKLVGQALALFEQCGDRLGQADGYKLKGMIFRDKKDYVLASSCFQTSLRINRDLDNKLNIAETFFELGLMERHRRRNQPALEAFGEAAALFRQVGAREEMRKAEQEIRTINGGHHAS